MVLDQLRQSVELLQKHDFYEREPYGELIGKVWLHPFDKMELLTSLPSPIFAAGICWDDMEAFCAFGFKWNFKYSPKVPKGRPLIMIREMVPS